MTLRKSYEDEVERFQHGGQTVVIFYDRDAENPRKNDGNLCRIVHWHREYICGDEQVNKDSYSSAQEVWEEIEQKVKDAGDEVIAFLPVWIYQHGSVNLRASKSRPGYPFNCQWDSGQVGWAYVTRKTAALVGCKPGESFTHDGKTTTYNEDFFLDAIVSEIEIFDKWGNGGFTGYTVFDRNGEPTDSSCWGFDDVDYCKKEAMSAAEYEEADEKRARKKFTKAAWKRAVAKGETEESYEAWLRAMRAQKGHAA